LRNHKHKAPNLLHKGLEFENKHCKKLLINFKIKMYRTKNEKSAIIERFNRTLNNKMRIQFEARNNNKVD